MNYTNEQKQFVLDNYKKLGPVKCAKILQINYKQVGYLAAMTKQTEDKIFILTDEQKQWLMDNATNLTIAEFATHFRCSKATIVRYGMKYNISFDKRYALAIEQENWLINNADTYSYQELQDILKLPKNTIMRAVKRLNLKNHKFSDKIGIEGEEWLRNNYPQKSRKECYNYLKISPARLGRILKQLGLKSEGEIGQYFIDMDKFYNIDCPYIAYFLGFFWGDGHISKPKTATQLTINIVRKDYENIKEILHKYINWDVKFTPAYCDRNGVNHQEQAQMSIRGNRLGKFLVEHDYLIKSGASPDKILSKIPEHLKHYWFRGYLDADGCILIKDKYSVSFSSVYEQNWSFLKDLSKKLNIDKIKIYQKIEKDSRSSSLEITRMHNIRTLLNYVYKDNHNIGLIRKLNKYLQFGEKYKISRINNKASKYKNIDFNKQTQKWRSFIRLNNKSKCLGYFITEEAAYLAQQNKLKELNINFKN